MMKEALRRDFCSKVAAQSGDTRRKLHEKLVAQLPRSVHRRAIDALCSGGVTMSTLSADDKLMELVDGGLAVEPLMAVTGGTRRSYLSLQTAWEHLNEWCASGADVAAACHTEWDLMMHLGAMGQPVEVRRSAVTSACPFGIEVTRVCPSPADTASFANALRCQHSIVPPEGGVAVEDLLVLVDPDAPRASRLAASTILLRETYTSVVLHRNLHMYTGIKMHLALHAHSLFTIVQPPPSGVRQEDFVAHIRRDYLGRAYQCAQCFFGPIDHFACGDLAYHNGQRVGQAVINNACPRCGWFSRALSDWPKWDGTVPPEALSQMLKKGEKEPDYITESAAEVALRICYSARAMWNPGENGEARALCNKLGNWETLTAADGVDHPVLLLLALAVSDDVPDGVLGEVPVAALLLEVCGRKAEDDVRRSGAAAVRNKVAAFLGVSPESAPQVTSSRVPEPRREAVLESCRGDYALHPEAFDYKAWVRGALTPWTHAVLFARRLRVCLQARQGGWHRLARDMEVGPAAYADVVSVFQKPPGTKDTPAALLGVSCQDEASRILATVAAQAFLHESSESTHSTDAVGLLGVAVGDVREEETLRALCVQLRMALYDERLAAKNARFMAARQKFTACEHVHNLDGETFWHLWKTLPAEERRQFFMSAEHGFREKYGL